MEEKLVIIDTDAGVDDAWALFMAAAAQNHSWGLCKVKILAVTTVCGNSSVDHVVNNVTRVFDTVNDTTTLIYPGMSNFLTRQFSFLEDPPYFGYDGFGDANLPKIQSRVQNLHGVLAIIKVAEENKGKVTYISLGPMTNLAMAVKLQPMLRTWLKEIYILGGNIAGVGNVGPTGSAEYNFFADCEAAEDVLDSFEGCPIFDVPWEVVLKHQSSYYFRTQVLGRMKTKQIELLNKIEEKHLVEPQDNWVNPDALLMACALFKKATKKVSEPLRYDCENTGTLTRGMMVLDRNPNSPKPKNMRIIEEIEQKFYESLLVWAAGGPAPLGVRFGTEEDESNDELETLKPSVEEQELQILKPNDDELETLKPISAEELEALKPVPVIIIDDDSNQVEDQKDI